MRTTEFAHAGSLNSRLRGSVPVFSLWGVCVCVCVCVRLMTNGIKGKEKQRPSLGGNGSVTQEYSTKFLARAMKPKELVPVLLSAEFRRQLSPLFFHWTPQRFQKANIRSLTFCRFCVLCPKISKLQSLQSKCPGEVYPADSFK